MLNDSILDVITDYSIQKNVQNLLANNPSAELKQFLTDMLYYGAASQTYRGYNDAAEKLATYGVEGLGTPSDIVPPEADKMNLSTATGTARFKGATVWFDSVNKLIIKLGNSSDATLKVMLNGSEVTNGILDSETQTYTTAGIKATGFDDVYTFELYEGGNVVHTLTYSVNAYVYSIYTKSENNNMKNLALALYRYGVSADQYADSLKS